MMDFIAFGSVGVPGSTLGEGARATGDAGDAGETGAEDTASTATVIKPVVFEEDGERFHMFFFLGGGGGGGKT